VYLRDALYVLARRWYIVVPLFVVLAFGTNVMVKRTPYSYRASATVVLLPPAVVAPSNPGLANPYLGFTGNLAATGAILARAVTTDSAADGLARQGSTATYAVRPDPSARDAPVLLVTASSTRTETSSRTLDGVVNLLRSELDTRQRAAKAPPKLFITLSVISSDSPRRLDLARTKALGGGLAVAVLFPMVIALVVEGIVHRRSGPARAAEQAAAAEQAEQAAAAHRRGSAGAAPPRPPARVGPAGAGGASRRAANDPGAGMHSEDTMRVSDVAWAERTVRVPKAPAGDVHDENTMRVTDVSWAQETVRVNRAAPRTYPDPAARPARPDGARQRPYPEPRTYPDPRGQAEPRDAVPGQGAADHDDLGRVRGQDEPRGYPGQDEPRGYPGQDGKPDPRQYAEHPTLGGNGISFPREDPAAGRHPDDDRPASPGRRRRR
jgi:hypothetical protein